MKVKSESEVTQLCPTLSDPMDCSLPGSSVHGIFQARVLEWGAIAFSGNLLSLPQIHVVCWLLIVNIIKELELGREETLEIWAGFEMLWSKSVTTLLALEAQSILTRPPAVVLTGPGGPIYTDKAPCSCTDHRLRQMRQSAATAWSWIANEHGNDFTRSYLKLPGSLSITQ